jgi:hypothetical protein
MLSSAKAGYGLPAPWEVLMRVPLLCSFVAIGLFIPTLSALSASLEIHDLRWAQLSRAEQQRIVQQLQEKGALEKDDRVVYTGPQPNSEQTNLSVTQIIAIGQALAPVLCAAKVAYNKLQCERKPAGSDKEQCLHESEENGKQMSLICIFN